MAGEKERIDGRGWVREAAARGDIMMGTTAQLEHSFERLYLRAHHGRHASARMSEKSGAGRRRAAADLLHSDSVRDSTRRLTSHVTTALCGGHMSHRIPVWSARTLGPRFLAFRTRSRS